MRSTRRRRPIECPNIHRFNFYRFLVMRHLKNRVNFTKFATYYTRGPSWPKWIKLHHRVHNCQIAKCEQFEQLLYYTYFYNYYYLPKIIITPWFKYVVFCRKIFYIYWRNYLKKVGWRNHLNKYIFLTMKLIRFMNLEQNFIMTLLISQ